MRINKLSFENFRVFNDKTTFNLAPITILTGANSSGKSTLIKGLKLFQGYWSQGGFKNKLEFEKGIHQLGDFEMALSKNSNKKELKVFYEFEHILFGNLEVELVYELDSSTEMKNGILKYSSIKRNDDILWDIEFKNGDKQISFNYKVLIYELFPTLQESYLDLKKEYDEYNRIIDDSVPFEPSGKTVKPYYENHRKANIDSNKFKDLYWLFNKEFKEKTLSNYRADWIKATLDSIIESDYLSNFKMWKAFSNLNKSAMFNIYDHLWNLIRFSFPEVEERYNYLSFKNMMETAEEEGELNIIDWKEDYLLSSEQNFEDYLKNKIDLALDILSSVRTEADKILFTDDKNTAAFYLLKNINNGYYMWKQILAGFFEQENLNINQKAFVNFYMIIEDLIYLEKKLLNNNSISSKQTLDSLFNDFFESLYKKIEEDFNNMFFIDSIRATSQRLYTTENQSNNFNSFIVDFLKRNLTNDEKSFITKWLNEFEIADSYKIEIIRGIGSQLYLVKGNDKTNIVDMGYGVTQFLPILLKIAYSNNIGKKTIIIEEPETNLHPKFQSKLADLFIDAYKTFDIEFIIETHSEYFIRKLQFLTARKDISTDDSVIYYLSNPDKERREVGEEQLREIHIQPNGVLTKPFGSGFYDEADNLSIELMIFSLN